MPKVLAQFFKLSRRLVKACPGDWILTPNERLAREFRQAYDAEQLTHGKRAWTTPRVASINHFIKAGAAQCLPFSDRPKLLSPEAELLLWQELGERESERLCALAADAWRLVHAYRVDLDDEAFAATINSRMFRRWARRFRERLRQAGLITQAELADLLPGNAQRLHLVAFDVVTPQVVDFLRRSERAGGVVRQHQPGAMRNGPQKRVESGNRASEIHAAAQWARRVLARYPTAHIGVVFPYLTDAYFAIVHAFGVEFADAPEAVNISGGTPLREQPIWRDAELILRLALAEISHREWQRVQHSRWLTLGTPLAMPAESPEMLHVTHLSRASGVLRRLASRSREFPHRQSFGLWVDAFRSLLALAGWSASNTASVQYQAYRQLTDCLERYSGFEQLPNLTGADALQTLERLLSSRLFAPQRPPAPVQVLGYLETTGLVFSHLWAAGLQDTAWPASPRPNPLLPVALQRLHGVPRTDHLMEGEFATEQMRRWRRACRYLVVSHAVDDSEERHRCSSLVESIPPITIERLVPRFRVRRHPWLSVPPRGTLQPVTQAWGSPVQGTVTRGGTSLLRDQAQCPFRAWAIHRLGLTEAREPHNYPDAIERGILVHDALFALYSEGAGGFTAAQIERAVAATLNKRLRPAPEIFRQHEGVRIRRLLQAWVDFDSKRPDFSIVGLERKERLALPGLELTLRIDRIDRDTKTNAHIVIDYKTGNVTAKGLLAERLTEPQLPMYALTDPTIRSTLYAQIGSDTVTFKGLASDEMTLGKARVQPLSKEEWEDLTARWRSQIEALARAFRAGHAALDPSSRSVCDNCHLPSFCRVYATTPSGDAGFGSAMRKQAK